MSDSILFDAERQQVTEVTVWEDVDGNPAWMQSETHPAEVVHAEDGAPVAFWTDEDLA